MNWRKVSIGELGRIVTGKTPPTGNREFYDGEYPFVTPTDLDWQSYIVRSTHSSVTELARDRNKNQFIPANSTVFTCIGNTIGKCGLSTVDCLTNQQINSVVPADEHDPKFIYYLLNYHRPQIRSLGLGNGAAQPIINKTTFSGVKVSVPATRDDEQRIATILSAYDDLIENNRRRIALLEEAARQLYKEWFVRFRFPGHEHVKIIDGVPEGWERIPASYVLHVFSGGTPKTTTPQFWDGNIGFFTPKDAVQGAYVSVTEKTITEEGLAKCNSKLYPKDTLFITARGTVGKMNLAFVPMAMNQSCYALVSKSCLSQRLLYLTMDASLNQFRSQASGAVFDAIIVATFDRISVIYPDAKIAEAFDDVINPIFDQIGNLGKQTEQLARARDLLLPKLMSRAIAV